VRRHGRPARCGHRPVCQSLDRQRQLETRPPIASAEPVEVSPRHLQFFRHLFAASAGLIDPPRQRSLTLARPTTRGLLLGSHWDYFLDEPLADQRRRNEETKILAASAGPVGQCGQREALSKALWASRTGRFGERRRGQFVPRRYVVDDRLVQGGWGQVGGGRTVLLLRPVASPISSSHCAVGRPRTVPIRRQCRHLSTGSPSPLGALRQLNQPSRREHLPKSLDHPIEEPRSPMSVSAHTSTIERPPYTPTRPIRSPLRKRFPPVDEPAVDASALLALSNSTHANPPPVERLVGGCSLSRYRRRPLLGKCLARCVRAVAPMRGQR